MSKGKGLSVPASGQSHLELCVKDTAAFACPYRKEASFSFRANQLFALGLPREDSEKVNFQAPLALRDPVPRGSTREVL